jgi:hypothetical protein
MTVRPQVQALRSLQNNIWWILFIELDTMNPWIRRGLDHDAWVESDWVRLEKRPRLQPQRLLRVRNWWGCLHGWRVTRMGHLTPLRRKYVLEQDLRPVAQTLYCRRMGLGLKLCYSWADQWPTMGGARRSYGSIDRLWGKGGGRAAWCYGLDLRPRAKLLRRRVLELGLPLEIIGLAGLL